MMTELKPCPFCGEPVKMEKTAVFEKSFGFYHKDMLGKCPLSLGVFIHDVSENEAIEIWNRRFGNE